MQYVARTPSLPLGAFVERLWYCADAPSHARERVLPGGGIGLVINLAEQAIRTYDAESSETPHAHGAAVVRGPGTRSFFYDPRGRASLVGVYFKPGGAFPLLGISPSEFVDAFVSLEDLWGTEGRVLREQLLEVSSPRERLQVLERALLVRVQRARLGHPASRAAVAAFQRPDARVVEVAERVGLSHRRFAEIFRTEVGLTPKLYARLQRFDRAKRGIASLQGAPFWARLAIDCGYFDQSHMIRDFKEFANMSPTDYLRARSAEASFDHLVHRYGVRRA